MPPNSPLSTKVRVVFLASAETVLPTTSQLVNKVTMDMHVAPAQGVLHSYGPGKVAFEHTPTATPSSKLVLFIGGLGDAIGSVAYVPVLARALVECGWSVAEIQMDSSYGGWGLGSIMKDAQEVGRCVEYFMHSGKKRIVLLGQSTGMFYSVPTMPDSHLRTQEYISLNDVGFAGTQDIIAYAYRQRMIHQALNIHGAILQAPVSDREYLESVIEIPNLDATIYCKEDEDPSSFIPRDLSTAFGPQAIDYRRWVSLVYSQAKATAIDPHHSEDFFSSDLNDTYLASVFEPLQVPTLLLLSGEDECYPTKVKERLSDWSAKLCSAVDEIYRSLESGIIVGASHTVETEATRKILCEKVVSFLVNEADHNPQLSGSRIEDVGLR